MEKNTILALFEKSDDADNALSQLAEKGFTESEVSVVTKEDKVKIERNTGEGVKQGAKTGGIVGGIVGLLVGIGALTIPGIGALLISGPIAAALGLTGAAATTASGALTGALAGGLIGALRGLGIDEVQARLIENRIKEGDILVIVLASDNDSEDVTNIMQNNNADHITEMKLNV